MIARKQFLAAVSKCIGTPVVHGGRLPGVGLDCVGVPIAACNLCGLYVEEPPPYRRMPDSLTLRTGLQIYCDEIEYAHRMPGDLIQVMMGRQARHVVVLVGVNECGQELVIHAYGKRAVVQTTIMEGFGEACWRIRGMI